MALYIQQRKTHMMANLTSEAMEDRKQWNNIFKVLKKSQAKILYLAKIIFKNESEIRMFLINKSW